MIFPPIQKAAFSVELNPSTSFSSLRGVSLLTQLLHPEMQGKDVAADVTMGPVEDQVLGVS